LLLSVTRACRDAVAFSAVLSAEFAAPVRDVFTGWLTRKFFRGKGGLPAYETRRYIDIFYMNRMEGVAAKLLRLLQVPAEIPKLVREVLRVSDEKAAIVTENFLKLAGSAVASDGGVSATVTSRHLLYGSHEDWREHRALYNVILHMPPGVGVDAVLRVARRILPNPRRILKELYDKGIVFLQGVGRRTLVWTAPPPPRCCSIALLEVRRRGIQDAALQLLQGPVRVYANGTSDLRLKEALKILIATGVVSQSFKITPSNSIFMEAALSEVYPLTQLLNHVGRLNLEVAQPLMLEYAN